MSRGVQHLLLAGVLASVFVGNDRTLIYCVAVAPDRPDADTIRGLVEDAARNWFKYGPERPIVVKLKGELKSSK